MSPSMGALASLLRRSGVRICYSTDSRPLILGSTAASNNPHSARSPTGSTSSAVLKRRSNMFAHGNGVDPYAHVRRQNPMDLIPSNSIELIGETGLMKHFCLNDMGGALFHSLNGLVWRMNTEGLSFAKPLSVEDLLVEDGQSYYDLERGSNLVVSKRYARFVLKDTVEFCSATPDTINQDNIYASLVLKDLLMSCCGADILSNIDDGLNDLFSSMENPLSSKGYPILLHPSLLPIDYNDEAYLDVYDLMDGRTLKRQTLNALLLNLPGQSSWDVIARSNVLLNKWYENPKLGFKAESAWDYLSFITHVYRHPAAFQYKTTVGCYTDRDLKRLVRFKYGLVLPDLYRKLWKENPNILKKLRPHRFFLP